ncbi:MAG TPA: hypothetical protein GXX24_09340 [Paracoccus solventivorans]|uniref:Uncharacterized protein n=1 Tax=Paracoccus solventivorans TaxID=53463 RepID=A0A832PMN1_9RHOB|nr:hypothetical protein [Paracoccus solventivorans]HHW34324.1 hypothetical protein [Paracoccus solventivorans]
MAEGLSLGSAHGEIAALITRDALRGRASCWGTRQSLVLPDEIPALAEITPRPKLPSTSPVHLNLIFNFLP